MLGTGNMRSIKMSPYAPGIYKQSSLRAARSSTLIPKAVSPDRPFSKPSSSSPTPLQCGRLGRDDCWGKRYKLHPHSLLCDLEQSQLLWDYLLVHNMSSAIGICDKIQWVLTMNQTLFWVPYVYIKTEAKKRSSHGGSVVINLTSIHEDVGLIPGLACALRICHCCGLWCCWS